VVDKTPHRKLKTKRTALKPSVNSGASERSEVPAPAPILVFTDENLMGYMND
jgi:hypothetical protein